MVLPVVVFVSPIPGRWIVAIIHRIVGAILWIPLEQKVTAKKVMHKPWKSRINLEFLIQRYGKNIEQV